jgi:hypothetical protein
MFTEYLQFVFLDRLKECKNDTSPELKIQPAAAGWIPVQSSACWLAITADSPG